MIEVSGVSGEGESSSEAGNSSSSGENHCECILDWPSLASLIAQKFPDKIELDESTYCLSHWKFSEGDELEKGE